MEDFQVRAQIKYVWQTPRKVRLVVDSVRGMPAEEALSMLKLMPKRAADPVLKLLKSAVANAENNFGMAVEDLYIASIMADEGPVRPWRRFGARGRFKRIVKRSSHITVVLRERAAEEAAPAAAARLAERPQRAGVVRAARGEGRESGSGLAGRLGRLRRGRQTGRGEAKS
jgi:large subunit ribosomal protein L22